MFYLETKNKSDCCGCGACEKVCPKSCIIMIEDEEGFYYPLKNEELCVNCNLCKRVCPNVNKDKLSESNGDFSLNPKAYMVIHKKEDILDKSSSGGAFSAIVDTFCDEGFIIFGVELDKNLNAIHSYTETIAGIEKYRKLKYIQSDIGDSYKEVEEFLKAGKKVLFTGTPCQIAGLRLYLRDDYDNLMCIDIVCHGVPSQKVFDFYVDYMQKKYKGLIKSFTFRHKTCNKGKWNSKNIKIIVDDKTRIINSEKDLFLRGFHRSLYCRPSCYECKYANSNRISDITMADFWGVEKMFPNQDPNKGVSALLVNTLKGEQLVKGICEISKLVEADRMFVIKNNSQLQTPTRLHPKRSKFFKVLLETKRFDKAVNYCIPFVRVIAAKVLNEKSKAFIIKLMK